MPVTLKISEEEDIDVGAEAWAAGFGASSRPRDSSLENADIRKAKEEARTPRRKEADICKTLFMHFLVVSLEETATGPEPRMLYHVPVSSEPLPSQVITFCWPDVHASIKHEDIEAQVYTFVLTETTGNNIYGFCRRFMGVGNGHRYPTCLCLLTRMASFNLFESLLEVCQARWLLQPGALFKFLNGFANRPLPQPGGMCRVSLGAEHHSFYRSSLPFSGSYRTLLKQLSPDNIMYLFSAILMEKRIVMTSKNMSVLSACIHAATATLFPLKWQHIFIPIMPPKIIDCVCAPMPFVIGMSSELEPKLLAMPLQQVLLVSLDEDKLAVIDRGGNNESQIDFSYPNELGGKLKRHIRAGKAIQEGFRAFFACLFSQADWHNMVDKAGKFDVDLMAQQTQLKGDSEAAEYLKQLRHVQMFERYVDGQVHRTKGTVLNAASLAQFELLRLETRASQTPFSYSSCLKRLKEMNVRGTGSFESTKANITRICLDVTSNNPQNRNPREQVDELIEATFDNRLLDSVMEVIWTRLNDCKSRNYKHALKSLSLLSRLLITGSDRVITRCLEGEHLQTLKFMVNYKHSDSKVGDKIKTHARRVVGLLGNIFSLRRERNYEHMPVSQFRVKDDEGTSKERGPIEQKHIMDTYQMRSLVEMSLPSIPLFANLHACHRSLLTSVASPTKCSPPPPGSMATSASVVHQTSLPANRPPPPGNKLSSAKAEIPPAEVDILSLDSFPVPPHTTTPAAAEVDIFGLGPPQTETDRPPKTETEDLFDFFCST